MKMWLYRADLDGYVYDVIERGVDSKSDEDVIAQHLQTYTDIIKHSGDSFPTEAIEPLEALLVHYPSHEALLIRLTHLRYQGSLKQDPNEALETLKRILEAHPKHEEALKLSIAIYFTQKRFAEALPLLTILIECEPDVVSHFALRRRAEAYHALNQLDKALVDLEQALSEEAFSEAVSRQEAREFVANWPYHPLFSKQPILPADDETYGVIEDEYTEYDIEDEVDYCDFLQTKLKGARAALAFHQPAASGSKRSVDAAQLETFCDKADESDELNEQAEKHQKVTRSGCGY